MRAAIVVPTIREDSIVRFLNAWRTEFAHHVVLVVEDNPTRTFSVEGENLLHFAWSDIDDELGADADIIPRRTDCVRSFGFLKALDHSPDMIVTLDDDCYPHTPNFLDVHFENLSSTRPSTAWVSSLRDIKPRGLPYSNLERRLPIVLSHGLWANVPDLDAPTQLSETFRHRDFDEYELPDQVIPRGAFFPMCGMNLAFRPELAACMYFLRMGQGEPFDRIGDIWAGLFVKRICDHLGLGVWSGSPVVWHERASNVWANLRKETPGLEINESLWEVIDQVVLTATTPADCYLELAEKLPLDDSYWVRLRDSMKRWASRF